MRINQFAHNNAYTTNIHMSSSKRLLDKVKIENQSIADVTVSISDSAVLRKLYRKELLQASEAEEVTGEKSELEKVDSLSVEELLKNYEKIYKGITNNMSESDKKLHLEALDDVFNDIAGLKADSIATSFDNIIDYAANQLPVNGMKPIDGILDRGSLKENLTSKILAVKNKLVENLKTMKSNDESDEALKNALAISGKSDNLKALEDMTLGDVDIISKIIKTGFDTKGETVDVMVRWSQSYDKIIQGLNLSEALKEKMKQAKFENIKAFAKIKIYKEETNSNSAALEKLAKRLKGLNELLALFDERLEKATDMNQKLRYLKREAGLKGEIGKVTKEMKEIEKRQNKLKKDPDSIEEYDSFKNTMIKYKERVKNI